MMDPIKKSEYVTPKRKTPFAINIQKSIFNPLITPNPIKLYLSKSKSPFRKIQKPYTSKKKPLKSPLLKMKMKTGFLRT